MLELRKTNVIIFLFGLTCLKTQLRTSKNFLPKYFTSENFLPKYFQLIYNNCVLSNFLFFPTFLSCKP